MRHMYLALWCKYFSKVEVGCRKQVYPWPWEKGYNSWNNIVFHLVRISSTVIWGVPIFYEPILCYFKTIEVNGIGPGKLIHRSGCHRWRKCTIQYQGKYIIAHRSYPTVLRNVNNHRYVWILIYMVSILWGEGTYFVGTYQVSNYR